MKKAAAAEANIEKSLLYLSLGTVAIFLVFIASFLWVQNVLSRSQTQNSELTSPVRAAVGSLKDAVSALLIREAQIASSQSAAEISKLPDRAAPEAAITAAQNQLVALFQGKDPSIDALGEQAQSFLDRDDAYQKAHLARWQTQEALDAKILGIETDLKDFLQSAQSISGKIRFAYGSSVRKIARIVRKSGYTPEARGLVTAQVLNGSSLKNGIVSEILGGAGELNRLAGKIGLVKTEDQLHSLLNNELVQLKERLAINLENLGDEVKDDAESAKIVTALQASLKDLSLRILAVDNPNSLMSLKKSVFENLQTAAKAQDELAATSGDLRATLTKLVQLSENTSATFDEALRRAGTQTRWLLLVISAVALGAGAFGGRAVKINLTHLRRQNRDLLRLKEDLTTINGSLEVLVEERTRAVRTILDHVSFGLMICDEKMCVREGSSRSCRGVFGTDGDLQGQDLAALLGLDARGADHLRATYSQIFDPAFLLGDLAVDQLPSRFAVNGRSLGLVGSVVHDASGRATGVLFCVSDISKLVDAEAEVMRNRSLIQMLGNRDSFRQFLADARAGFGEIYQELDRGTGGDSAARRHLHTLKGNFGMFGLAQIADAIHHLEDEPSIPRPLVSAIEDGLKTFLDANRELLGVSYGAATAESFVVPATLVDAVETKVRAGKDDLSAVFLDFFRLIRLKRARTYLGPIEDAFAQWAQRLGKQVTLRFDGENTLLPPKAASVLKCLPHLLRNALDHGIEAADQRGTKPKAATVRMAIEDHGNHVQIIVEDDGRGLDRSAILAKAVATGLVTAAQAPQMRDDDVYQLIFAAGLSTAVEVTDVSGRGVGMSAVQAAITEVGGTITINSTLGKGTRFVVKIPSGAATARTQLAA